MREAKRNKILIVAVYFLICFASAQSAMAKVKSGHIHGNPADAVMENGQLTLRDFAKNQTIKPVLQNDVYLENIDGFTSLIKEIANAKPLLAAMIWQDLVDAKMWTFDNPLPIPPKEKTSLVAKPADIQVSLRFPKQEILISTTAINELKNNSSHPQMVAYAMVHEALHPLVPEGPLHNDKVRSLTNWLKDNRGHYTPEAFNEILPLYDISLPDIFENNASSAWVINVLLQEKGDFKARCAIVNSVGRINMGLFHLVSASAMKKWGKYEQCPKTSILDVVGEIFPELKAYVQAPFDIYSDAFIYEMRPSNISNLRDLYLVQCRTYTDPALLTRATEDREEAIQFLHLAHQAEAVIANFNETGGTQMDIGKRALVHYVTTNDPDFHYDLRGNGNSNQNLRYNFGSLQKYKKIAESTITRSDNYIATFHKNTQVCTEFSKASNWSWGHSSSGHGEYSSSDHANRP